VSSLSTSGSEFQTIGPVTENTLRPLMTWHVQLATMCWALSLVRQWCSSLPAQHTLVILHIFHCACAKWLYFFFRSEIWRYHHVPWLRFPIRCEKFGDLQTLEADIGLVMFTQIFRTSWPKMGDFWTKQGKGWCDIDPQWTCCYIWGLLLMFQFWW